MAERCIKGDYIGFTFGGVHSSELGLMRVSDGSRYNTDLLPPLQDKTAQVNGRDGAVYFGSQYNTRPIKVPVAFDNMTEESFNQLKRLLQDKKPKYLWFDETPYKQWLVKTANAQSFKWVCFDESHNGKEKRIYKGEGTLEFSCFSPYAESRVAFLDEPVDKIIYKEGKRLKFGNPPFLEEITIENNTGANNIQHIYSSAILNNESADNIFNIPNYGLLDLSTDDATDAEDKIKRNKGAYIDFYNNKGYFSIVEHDSGNNVDEITDGLNGTGSKFLAYMHRIFGNSDGYGTAIYHDVQCYIISPEQQELVKVWSKNATEPLELKCQNYGHHYPLFETIFLSPKETIKPSKYYNWILFPTQTSNTNNKRKNPVLLIENNKGKLTVLTPTWKDIDNNLKTSTQEGREKAMSNIITSGEKEIPLGEIQINQLGVKILSPKGFEKINNSIQPTKRLLHLSYNYEEWAKSSRLREQKYQGTEWYNFYDSSDTNKFMPVYNAGDIPTDCQIIISKTNWETDELSDNTLVTFAISSSLAPDREIGKIIIKHMTLLDGDDGIIIDSKLKLIKGYKIKEDGSIQLTGTVYNKYKKEGDFFKIPICEDEEYYKITNSANIPFEIQYKHHYI